MVAPNPKLKPVRKKKLDFDPLTWSKYISEENLLEEASKVYGCDPRDTVRWRQVDTRMTLIWLERWPLVLFHDLPWDTDA
jgi:hypothetical protein